MSPASVLAKPYHRPLSVDGQLVDFAHLEPIRLVFHVKKLGRAITVDVRFSNHCYTEGFDPISHDPSWRVMDGKQERTFCQERYRLSKRLPAMVDALPRCAVWLTKHERNYFYFIVVEEPSGRYPMFFSLRRQGRELVLFVESAYLVDEAKMGEILRTAATKVSFPVLCAKIYRGETVRSHLRR